MEISVCYILYQIQPTTAFRLVLMSTLAQTAVPQIIVCEQNPEPTFWLKHFCRENQITYLFEHESAANAGNMGLLKNRCIQNAAGKYLYFNDTDIILYQKDYLKRIITFMEKSGDPVLTRAPMLRLTSGIDALLSKQALPEMNTDNPLRHCFVRYQDGKIIGSDREHWYYRDGLPHARIDESQEWQLCYHSGSLAIRRSVLLAAGGYCMDYYHWGLDDIDLQWKLNETIGVREINYCLPNLYVLHLEHESRKRSELYQKNREVFLSRIETGVAESIRKDVERYDRLS